MSKTPKSKGFFTNQDPLPQGRGFISGLCRVARTALKSRVMVAVMIVAGVSIMFEPDHLSDRVSRTAEMPAMTIAGAAVKRSQYPQPLEPDQPESAKSVQSTAFTPIASETAPAPALTEMPVDWLRLLYPELVRIAELESLPVNEALAEILPMLNNDDPAIRLAVVESLADMSTGATRSALSMAINDSNPLVRVAALEALSDSDDVVEIGGIETLLYDPQREVRLAAIEALANLEQEFVVHSLAGLLGDPDARIRLHAVHALGEIGGEYAMMYLLQLRYDPDAKIRSSAGAILAELEHAAAY